jgi:hypothetical protein
MVKEASHAHFKRPAHTHRTGGSHFGIIGWGRHLAQEDDCAFTSHRALNS